MIYAFLRTLEHFVRETLKLEAKFSRHEGVMNFMVITEPMKHSEVQVIVQKLEGHSLVLCPPAVLPLPN